jgi:hypothetical protein
VERRIKPMAAEDDLVYRLRKRAEIRRQIPGRKSVQEGKPDRMAELLDEAALEIETLRKKISCNGVHCNDGCVCDTPDANFE